MGSLARYLIVALVAFLVALAATWLMRGWTGDHHGGGELHTLMHEKLDLDPRQEARIDALEQDFAIRRKALEAEMELANRELAEAMLREKAYGPNVARAVDHSHHAMGELQKATLSHVFAMRAQLRPGQARLFDEQVAKVLTRQPPQ